LDALGVQRITVGVNKDPATIEFLQKLASENKLVFTATDDGGLEDVAEDIQPHLCSGEMMVKLMLHTKELLGQNGKVT